MLVLGRPQAEQSEYEKSGSPELGMGSWSPGVGVWLEEEVMDARGPLLRLGDSAAQQAELPVGLDRPCRRRGCTPVGHPMEARWGGGSPGPCLPGYRG